MKKILAIVLAIVMILSMAACGAKNDEIEVAVVLKTLSSEYWNYVKDGCDAAAADLGIKVTVVGPGAESDIEPQVAMIEQQIGAGCDAIVCAPNDAGAAAAALQAAIDKGIPVLSVDTNVGLWAAEKLGGTGNAVIIYGQEGDNTSNLRRSGYEAACAEAGLNVLQALSGQNTTDGATKAMEDLITSYGEEIDVVFCHNDDTAIGAMNACKTAGISDILIVGFDGNKSAVELIQKGELIQATIAQQPYVMGYEVVKAAVAAIKGEQVDEVIAAAVKVVTIENAQEYLDSLK